MIHLEQCSSPTNPVPNRRYVFVAGRSFPVPAIDFLGFRIYWLKLKQMLKQVVGIFVFEVLWVIEFYLKPMTHLICIIVNNRTTAGGSCTETATGWGTWSIRTTGALIF